MKIALIGILSFLSFQSFSMTTSCASYDHRLVYELETSDGGAPIEPTESLKYDYETLISIIPIYEVNTVLASTTFSPLPLWESEPDLSREHFSTTTQVKHLLVKALADDAEIFNDFILCKVTTYIGPPLP